MYAHTVAASELTDHRLVLTHVWSCRLASIEVAEFSIIDIKHGIQHGPPGISFGVVAPLVLGIGTGLKLALWLYCRRADVRTTAYLHACL